MTIRLRVFEYKKLGHSDEQIASNLDLSVEEVREHSKAVIEHLRVTSDPEQDIFLTLARLEDMYQAIAPNIAHGDLRHIREAQKILMNKMQIYGLNRPTVNVDARGSDVKKLIETGGEEVFDLLQKVNILIEGKNDG